MEAFERTIRLIGKEGFTALQSSHFAVVGVGGVGSFAAEALTRTGAGALTLVDADVVDVTNINRQIHATRATVGLPKVDVMRDRVLSINPDCRVRALHLRYHAQAGLDLSQFDYVLDCIDSVSDKEALIMDCLEAGVRVISSMGAGNRVDPSAFRVTDIYRTTGDPLARVMRIRLRKRGVRALKVVCSLEPPQKTHIEGGHRRFAASAVFATSAAGMLMASEAILDVSVRPGKEDET